jgi:cytochrome oxidase Cu insertion factor (SCO1/SenC/PrrC family)
MKQLVCAFVLGMILSAAAFGQAAPAPAPLALKVGDAAPDFELPSTLGGRVKLSDFHGKNNVVLAFFVLAFTGG